MVERIEQHGSVFTTWILGKRTTVVGSLDSMKMLLKMEHDLVEGALPSCRLMLIPSSRGISGCECPEFCSLREGKLAWVKGITAQH